MWLFVHKSRFQEYLKGICFHKGLCFHVELRLTWMQKLRDLIFGGQSLKLKNECASFSDECLFG